MIAYFYQFFDSCSNNTYERFLFVCSFVFLLHNPSCLSLRINYHILLVILFTNQQTSFFRFFKIQMHLVQCPMYNLVIQHFNFEYSSCFLSMISFIILYLNIISLVKNEKKNPRSGHVYHKKVAYSVNVDTSHHSWLFTCLVLFVLWFFISYLFF